MACRSEVVTDEGAFHKFISIAALHTATEDLACPLTLSPRQATSLQKAMRVGRMGQNRSRWRTSESSEAGSGNGPLSHREEIYPDHAARSGTLFLLPLVLASSQAAVRSSCARSACQSVSPTTDASAREFISKIFAACVSSNLEIRGMSQELEAKTESVFPWV